MVVGTAVMGKPLPAPVEGDTLDRLRRRPDASAARRLLRHRRPARRPRRRCSRAPPRASSTTSTASAARDSEPERPDEVATRLRRDARPRNPRQRPAAAAGPQDPAQLLLLRRLRPRDPEEDPGRARAAGRAGRATGTINPRWVGSGWTIFNNKGKPVRQYEPFFSRTRHRFEFGVMSASARCCSTTRPSASSPRCTRTTPTRRWCSTPGSRTYDVNDTVLVRSRADPDVGDYFRRLPTRIPAHLARAAPERRTRRGGASRGRQSRRPKMRWEIGDIRKLPYEIYLVAVLATRYKFCSRDLQDCGLRRIRSLKYSASIRRRLRVHSSGKDFGGAMRPSCQFGNTRSSCSMSRSVPRALWRESCA